MSDDKKVTWYGKANAVIPVDSDHPLTFEPGPGTMSFPPHLSPYLEEVES